MRQVKVIKQGSEIVSETLNADASPAPAFVILDDAGIAAIREKWLSESNASKQEQRANDFQLFKYE